MEPVRSFGDHIIAFRVVWRVSDDWLAHTWDAILSQRQRCDQIVAQSPSLQMFVSCISGVYTKAVGGGLAQTGGEPTRPVYPAVSYWAVFEGANQDSLRYNNLVMRLMGACAPAEVKQIKSQPHRHSGGLLADSGPLFVALKDQNGGFVNQKINRCLLARGAVAALAHPPNAKLVVLPQSKYLRQLPASVDALKAVGLYIDLDVLEGERLEPAIS